MLLRETQLVNDGAEASDQRVGGPVGTSEGRNDKARPLPVRKNTLGVSRRGDMGLLLSLRRLPTQLCCTRGRVARCARKELQMVGTGAEDTRKFQRSQEALLRDLRFPDGI